MSNPIFHMRWNKWIYYNIQKKGSFKKEKKKKEKGKRYKSKKREKERDFHGERNQSKNEFLKKVVLLSLLHREEDERWSIWLQCVQHSLSLLQ